VRQVSELDRGYYEAARAAALAGIPRSTLYYWAREEVVVPSISSVKEKRWSYADLLRLRVVSWLRHPKAEGDHTIPSTPMHQVRWALSKLDRCGVEWWRQTGHGRDRRGLWVDHTGRVWIDEPVRDMQGQVPLDREWLDLIAPFEIGFGQGPDLQEPRPKLRIVPGKVAGEPHLANSRLTTRSVAALAWRGFSSEQILALYPEEDTVALAEAVDLERQLQPEAARLAG
jgi:uncharacterized protein (DUF433 family)